VTRRRYRPLTTDDRALSDVVGYILSFTVVLVSVFAATSLGFSQLAEFQQDEEITNTERAFQLIEQNFDQIQGSQADARRSEISLEPGNLALLDPPGTSSVDVTVNGTGVDLTVPMRALRYQVGDTNIAFEGGAVFYVDQNQNTILEDGPEMFCRQRGSRPAVAIVSVVTLTGSTGVNFAGGNIGITGALNRSSLLYPLNVSGSDTVAAGTNVTVELDSEYAEAWSEHFTDDETGWERIGPDTYQCSDHSGNGIEIYVRQTSIDVSFSR
jgi:hypothetical protein